jgi:hypothetical protein
MDLEEVKNRKLKLLLNFLSKEECINIINGSYNLEILKNRILREIEKNFVTQFKGFYIGDFVDLKIEKYNTEQKYKDFEKKGDETYVSFSLQLNSNYEDGFFQFLVDDGNRYFQVHHGLGHLILYFSDLPKRTTPVTNGTKYTLVGSLPLIKKTNNKNTLL